MHKAAVVLGVFVMVCLVATMVGCQTKQPLPPIKYYPEDELEKLSYLIASERYMRETDDCLLRGLICRAAAEFKYTPDKRACQEKEEACVFAALKRWENIKERRGW